MKRLFIPILESLDAYIERVQADLKIPRAKRFYLRQLLRTGRPFIG